MKYEQAIDQVVSEGAIRVFRLSTVWHIVYRIKNGKAEQRDIYKKGEGNWEFSDQMVGMSTKLNRSGWYPVKEIHAQAVPIEAEGAEDNKRYYQELTRQCQTCKLEKSTKEFERDMEGEMGFRTWECNQCAKERVADKKVNLKQGSKRVGDYLIRNTRTSKPPVESEI